MQPMPLKYLPQITWWQAIAHGAAIEKNPAFQRRFSNRTAILSANGPLLLSIPVHQAALQAQTLIDLRKRWAHQHAAALRSAYGRAAWWLHYGDALCNSITQPAASLEELNLRLISQIAQWLKLPLRFSDDTQQPISIAPTLPYPQVFADRFPFQPNLSIVDLLMNLGPRARDYLRTEYTIGG